MFGIGAIVLKYRRQALPFRSTDAPYAALLDSLQECFIVNGYRLELSAIIESFSARISSVSRLVFSVDAKSPMDSLSELIIPV